MLLICMNKQSETGRAVALSKRFGVNILGADQVDLAERFAQKGGDKFAGVAVTAGKSGEPLFDDALATLECRVAEETPRGAPRGVPPGGEGGAAPGGGAPPFFQGQIRRLRLTRPPPGH